MQASPASRDHQARTDFQAQAVRWVARVQQDPQVRAVNPESRVNPGTKDLPGRLAAEAPADPRVNGENREDKDPRVDLDHLVNKDNP